MRGRFFFSIQFLKGCWVNLKEETAIAAPLTVTALTVTSYTASPIDQ